MKKFVMIILFLGVCLLIFEMPRYEKKSRELIIKEYNELLGKSEQDILNVYGNPIRIDHEIGFTIYYYRVEFSQNSNGKKCYQETKFYFLGDKLIKWIMYGQ